MMKKASSAMSLLLLFIFLSLLFTTAPAADPDPLQDICVADLTSGVKVNGFPCKVGSEINPLDFYSSKLGEVHAPNNTFGIAVTSGDPSTIPGLNTQGISLVRIDMVPGGVTPPHTHPRATEVIYVVEGSMEAAFITTANQYVSKILNKGDLYVFPRALIHLQYNYGPNPASFIASFNSQNPGIQIIPTALFAAVPAIPDVILAKSLQITLEEVHRIKASFSQPTTLI